MSVKKTSFSKKSFATLDVQAMSNILGGGDPFDPHFSERKKTSLPKEQEASVFSSSVLVG